MTIYELTGEWLELYSMADDPDIDSDTWFNTIEGIEEEIDQKAESYCRLIKQLEADAEEFKKEYERLYNRSTALSNKAKSLKGSLQIAMDTIGKDKIKTEHFTVGIQNNPPSLFIPDESKVPEKYLIPQPDKIDTKAIKEAIKNGESIDFATLQVGRSVRIR